MSKRSWVGTMLGSAASPRARRLANTCASAYFVTSSSALALLTLLLTVPHNSSGPLRVALTAAGLYMWLNVVANYALCALRGAPAAPPASERGHHHQQHDQHDRRDHLLEITGDHDGGDEARPMCVPCGRPVPPRAHHCSVCNACILKRDHHCFFVGRCVGHSNQRNFIVLLFWTAWGNAFILANLLAYMSDVLPGPLLSRQGLRYLLPLATVQAATGDMDLAAYALTLAAHLSLGKCLGCAAMYAWHFTIAGEGQTSYEAIHEMRDYDCGLFVNLRQVFGNYWALNYLLPMPTAIPGDGRSWERLSKYDKGL
uniref:Palmitoyltransferase n=1 Tax=Petromyzon marinus TaxID=7757 RepID=A0AAJ7TL48_PETMA|nr:probable palmitoyltransferase ZDHHC24 [Petromyzon marinus]